MSIDGAPALALADITCRFASRDERSDAYIAVANANLVIGRGEFVSFHIGRSHRIRADSVAAFIDRQVAAEGNGG